MFGRLEYFRKLRQQISCLYPGGKGKSEIHRKMFLFSYKVVRATRQKGIFHGCFLNLRLFGVVTLVKLKKEMCSDFHGSRDPFQKSIRSTTRFNNSKSIKNTRSIALVSIHDLNKFVSFFTIQIERCRHGKRVTLGKPSCFEMIFFFF